MAVDKMKSLNCRHCGGEMYRTMKTNSDLGMQGLGCLVFLAGIVLLVFFPIGTIIGAVMMLISLRMGYSRSKVWKCRQCGYFFDRD